MNLQDPESATFRFEVDPDSIDTNDAARDIALRSAAGMDAIQYDSITFESTAVKLNPALETGNTRRTFQVTGNLVMHGETRRITIPIELLAVGNGSDKKLRCGFMSRFVVNRSDFGLDAMSDTVGDSVAVTFCFQAVRQEKGPAEDPEKETSIFRFAPDSERQAKSGAADDIEIKAKTDPERDRLEELFNPKNGDDPDEVAPDAESSDSSGDEIEIKL